MQSAVPGGGLGGGVIPSDVALGHRAAVSLYCRRAHIVHVQLKLQRSIRGASRNFTPPSSHFAYEAAAEHEKFIMKSDSPEEIGGQAGNE